MTSRLLTAHALSNWDAWLAANQRGPRVRVEGAFDGKRGDGHPRARGGIDLRHFGPGGAYDAAPSNAPSDNDFAMAKMRFLAQRLSAADWADFQRVLCNKQADEPEAEDGTEEHDRYLGQAELKQDRKRAAELAARPAPTMDAANRLGFDAMYPRAGRVRRVEYAPQPESPAAPVTAAGLASFQAMFPGVPRVKRV